MNDNNIKAMILAAGLGKRLRTGDTDAPKALREACGKPLLQYVLDALSFIDVQDTILIVGYGREQIAAKFPEYPSAVQEKQLGTGHAAASAKDMLADYGGNILITCGDMPLVSRNTYKSLIDHHIKTGADATILADIIPQGSPIPKFGRITRSAAGTFAAIVEDKDCTATQREIREVNAGVYVFNSRKLFNALSKLRNNNAQNEYYLTDAPAIIAEHGGKTEVLTLNLGDEVLGVNTHEDLEKVERIISRSSS